MSSIRPKTLLVVALAAVSAMAVSACGTQEIQVASGTPMHGGAVLFQERCAGCHSLAVAGSNGSASNIRSALRNNGPNFNVRKETYQRVLYAIQNGGFSGAIMPQNIVTGPEAKLVAAFLAKYAGADVHTPASPSQMTGGAAAAKPAPAPKQDLAALGATVFTSNGCGACHQLTAAGATGQVGPSLNKIGSKPAAMIKQSIVNPNAVIAAGYAKGIMPPTFGASISAKDLDALIAYLQKVAR
ncbi:MAG: c-type cytochrome [Actinomycetes bacterium]